VLLGCKRLKVNARGAKWADDALSAEKRLAINYSPGIDPKGKDQKYCS
jgi:hypothetical protein